MQEKRMKPRSSGYGAIRALVHCFAFLFVTAAHAQGPLVWALGDSLTAGYGLPPAQGFTVRLEQALRKSGVPATVKNGGIAGDTAAQGRARLAWGLRGLGVKPDLVIVELGANDMLRGMPPAAVEQNLDLILAELKRRQIKVLIVGMKAAPNLGVDYAKAFDTLYPRLARKYGDRLYPFFLDGVAGKAALIQADGKHPNAQGVDIIVGRMLPTIRAALR
ncbi:arylesterase [Sphingomonas sp. CGMCC 1.13654]|uniref:Arylesterase n=2 Tax=Sphingomonas chungangi TaxID=2683589 RepID=A0A838L0P9_9SPHN|nr:arylesterase [Sphingomonas chungangi]MVW56250.1 arylesterase [Sphingomonas chungangi]